MADNIVESLFGPTPWQIQQAQNQQLGAAADKYASQDPFQRATGTLYRAGGMLAQPAAQALGMANPALQEAQSRQQAMSGIDMSSGDAILKSAQNIADPRLKLQLTMLGQQRKAAEQEAALKAAHAQYYLDASKRSTTSQNTQLAAKLAIARNDLTKQAQQLGYSGQEFIDFVENGVKRVEDEWNRVTGNVTTPGAVQVGASTEVAKGIVVSQSEKDAMIADAKSRGDMGAIAKLQELPVSKPTALPKSKAEVAGEVEAAKTREANNPEILRKAAIAKAEGKELGETSGKAQTALAGMDETVNEVKRNVKELISHPGFSSTVGATLVPGMRFIEGTKQADFMQRLEQIKGGAFLKAYETLKGGGQITEIEGKKATDAMMRMSKSVSEKEFKLAADDFVRAIEIGMNKLKMQASLGTKSANKVAPPAGFVEDK